MEPKPNEIQYMGSAQHLPAVQKQAIETGVQWVRAWYTARAQELGPDGKPYLSEDQLNTVLKRLDNLRVYCGHDPLGELANDLNKGKIHFTPASLKYYDTTTLLNDITRERHNPDILGAHCWAVSEPHICLNATGIDAQIQQYQQRQKDVRPYSLTEITIHELTHLVETNPKELVHIQQIHAQYSGKERGLLDPLALDESNLTNAMFSGYKDSPLEIHARMNVMRYQFGINPNQHVGYEELLRMRESFKETKQADPQLRQQFTPNDVYGNGPIQQMPVDHYIIESYPIPELKRYFNEVSQDITRDQLMEEEHREAHPDTKEKNTLRPTVSPQLQEQRQIACRAQRSHGLV